MPAQPRKVYVAVVGVGLVGAEFVKQLLHIPTKTSPFRLISLSSSKRTLYTAPQNPITRDFDWKSALEASTDKPDLFALVKNLSALLSSSENASCAIVDNTSSEEIAALYPTWLQQGISVITPSKKAYSGSLELYESIVAASNLSGAKYFREATVGAGLPIISTLKDLVATGDRVKPSSCWSMH